MYIRIPMVYKTIPTHYLTTEYKQKFEVLSFPFILLCEFFYLKHRYCFFNNMHTCKYYTIYYLLYMFR